MASVAATQGSKSLHRLACSFAPLAVVVVLLPPLASSLDFRVGGDRGWTKPAPNDTREPYNEWASRNRFRVGDTLRFTYQRDSVLVVNYTSYEDCFTLDPTFRFADGNTTFRLDRQGFFCFISGQPGHCRAGQKLVVRVMVQSEIKGTVAALPPPTERGGRGGDGDGRGSFDWGPYSLNSTVKLCVASYFMTTLGGVLAILYFFM